MLIDASYFSDHGIRKEEIFHMPYDICRFPLQRTYGSLTLEQILRIPRTV